MFTHKVGLLLASCAGGTAQANVLMVVAEGMCASIHPTSSSHLLFHAKASRMTCGPSLIPPTWRIVCWLGPGALLAHLGYPPFSG